MDVVLMMWIVVFVGFAAFDSPLRVGSFSLVVEFVAAWCLGPHCRLCLLVSWSLGVGVVCWIRACFDSHPRICIVRWNKSSMGLTIFGFVA